MTPAARFIGTFAGRGLQWEWRIWFDIISPYSGNLVSRQQQTFTSRKAARRYKAMTEQSRERANIRFVRRLVQTNWEPYNDSFGWNKGNGQR